MARYKDYIDCDVLDLGAQARPTEEAQYKPGDTVLVEGKFRGKVLRSRRMKYHYQDSPKKNHVVFYYTIKLEDGRIAKGTEEELRIDPIEYMKKNKQ